MPTPLLYQILNGCGFLPLLNLVPPLGQRLMWRSRAARITLYHIEALSNAGLGGVKL
jgi:hypothetical protein